MSTSHVEPGKRRVSLSIGSSALEKGAVRAEEENRSFSNYVETLILRDCERPPVGKIWPEEAAPDADLSHRKVVKAPDQAAGKEAA